MEMQTNPATIAMVMNDLAFEEIHVMPRIDDHRYSKEVVRAILAKDGTVPTIILEGNLRAGTLTVLMAGEEINVPSLFNNGSGFFFRNDDGKEFLYIDHYAHQVVLSENSQKFETHAGWREGMRKLDLENLRQQLEAAQTANKATWELLRRAMLLLATEVDKDTLSSDARETFDALHNEVLPQLEAFAAANRAQNFV